MTQTFRPALKSSRVAARRSRKSCLIRQSLILKAQKHKVRVRNPENGAGVYDWLVKIDLPQTAATKQGISAGAG
jgi:hypothetical protein